MLEKLVSLLERFVSAVEVIAEYQKTGLPVQPAIENALPAGSKDYDAIAAAPGGDAVIRQMCVDRGIEIPPRTRTTTLVQKLKTRDAADAAIKEAESVENVIDKANETFDGLTGVSDCPAVLTEEELNPPIAEKPVEPKLEKVTEEFVGLPESPFDLPDPLAQAQVYTPEEVRTCLQHWYSDIIGVPNNHPTFRTKAGEATKMLMALLGKYGQNNPKNIPEDVCQTLMAGEPELVKIYETRVKGVL